MALTKTSQESAQLGRFVKGCGACVVLALIGSCTARAAALFTTLDDPTIPQGSDFYHYTFVRFEPAALCGMAAFFFVLTFILPRLAAGSARWGRRLEWKHLPWLVALGVIVATCAGRFAVHQNFDLCIDEYLNDFEVGILQQHHLVALVPEEWRPYESAMKVPYENYNAMTASWTSGFLPGFASLDYLFTSVGANWGLSPVLAGLSIILLASIARRTFPIHANFASNTAVLLLALSPQFLAMALTKFAWTAHLCGSLLWIWLLIHPNRFVFLLTPILGVLLIGLHQPHVHPLVAAPFVLRLLHTRRWRAFLWFLGWYLLGAWMWYQVYGELRPAALETGGELANLIPVSTFSFAVVVVSLLFAMFHAITFFAWTTPLLIPFLGMFLLNWRDQPIVVRDGFLAACLTFLFYLSFPHPQGHGWGFRYIHSVYGLLALAAAGGALTLYQAGWQNVVTRSLLAGAVFTLLIQLPYRVYEIRTMVGPLAATWDYIIRQKSDFVVIETSDFWYSWDLIRNDPWLHRRPLIFNGNNLTPAQLRALKEKGTVFVIGADQVKPFDVILSDPKKRAGH